MEATERPAARAVVLSPERRVLLMQFRFPWRDVDVWITPGGSLREDEDARQAVLRELQEETGLTLEAVGSELWTRSHELTVGGQRIVQRERYFLVQTHEFEPRAAGLEEGEETDWFRGFRWWPVAELPDSSEEFAPRRLGELLRVLLRNGPPSRPFAIPV